MSPVVRNLSPTPTFPVFSVTALLDGITVALTRDSKTGGPVVEGDRLYVLGESSVMVPGTGAPLVVPKASLHVKVNAGEYVIATSDAPLINATFTSNKALSALVEQLMKSSTSDSSELLGNPGAIPVRVGDRVIRREDLPRYVTYLKQNPQERP